MSDQFFLIFISTIIITRLVVYLFPIPSPTIKSFRLHHYMFGIIGIVIGLLFSSILIYAIGIGLFIDELAYILIGGKTHKDNYSKKSLLGTVFFILLVFIFKNYLILPL